MDDRDQIDQSQGRFLSTLSLHDAETYLQECFGHAQNEMVLVYGDDRSPALSFNVSPVGGGRKEADIETALRDSGVGDPSALTVTHNHPNGAPLSDADIRVAIGLGVQQVRAVGEHGVFSLQRPEVGWPKVEDSLKPLIEAYEAAKARMKLEKRGLYPKDVELDAKDPELYHLMQWYTLEEFAPKIGATFAYEDLRPPRERPMPDRKTQLEQHLDRTRPLRKMRARTLD